MTQATKSTARPGPSRPGRLSAIGASAAAALAACLLVPAAAEAHSGQPGGTALDLGPANLSETRTTSTLVRGVTLTRITRGASDPALVWTLEVLIGPTAGSPDPDAPPTSISDEASANVAADRLRSKGFSPRVEAVAQPRAVDVAPGTLGYRVRIGSWPSKAAADIVRAEVIDERVG